MRSIDYYHTIGQGVSSGVFQYSSSKPSMYDRFPHCVQRIDFHEVHKYLIYCLIAFW
jgi:hypothetical protein